MLKNDKLVHRIASRLIAIEFSNQKELNQYLKDHPAANKANHTVVENKKETKKDESLSRRNVKKVDPKKDKPRSFDDESGAEGNDKSGIKYRVRSENPDDYTSKMTKIDPKTAIKRVTDKDSEGKITFKWIQNGKPVTSEQMKQIDKLRGGQAFSPGYDHVNVNPDPKASLQAYYVTIKGTIGRQYSAEHTAKSAKIKFGRIARFNTDILGMRETLKKDQSEGEAPAFLIDLMDKTGFRVGQDKDTGAEHKAYGITTLQGRHVRVDGDEIQFLFSAKEGVVVSRALNNRVLAKFIQERLLKTKPNEKLFPDVPYKKFNDYMVSISPENRRYMAKDLRTYHGTLIATRVIKKGMPVHNEQERKALIKLACEEASKFLENTPVMAKTSYIDKHVWDMIQMIEEEKKVASAGEDNVDNLNEFIETTTFMDDSGNVVDLPFEEIGEEDPDA